MSRSGLSASISSKMTWYSPNEPVQVHGLTLHNPMTYIGDPARTGEPSAINLKHALGSGSVSDSLGYWPNYGAMTSSQRRYYVEWMASGRVKMPLELGYAFVFFYGLERRALHEQKDKTIIFEEVARLRALHLAGAEKASASFMGYTGSLLWLLLAQEPHLYTDLHVQSLIRSGGRWQDEHIAALLMWCGTHVEYLPGWLAFVIAKNLADSQQGVISKNAEPQMHRLFYERYRERLPQGLLLSLETPGRSVSQQICHYTASAVLGGYQHKFKVSKKLLSSLSFLSKLWNECYTDLRPYGSLVNKARQSGVSADPALCWEALPALLRKGNHPCQAVISETIDPLIARQQFVVVAISQLATLAKIPTRDRYSGEQSARVARLVEYCGYALEPDTRITGKAYAAEETVILYKASEEEIDVNRYNAACLMLKLGLLAASANDKPDQEQLGILAQHILEVFGLNGAEQVRMKALAGLLLRNGVDMVGARDLLEALTAGQREAIGNLLIAIAAHDGIITSEERKSLRKCFDRLGLGAAVLDSQLNALRSTDGVTVVERAKRRNTGEAIPTAPDSTKQDVELIQLDRSAIEALLRDTREVQQALAQAMVVEDESPKHADEVTKESEPLAASETAAVSEVLSLDERYQHLYLSLIKRDMWPIDEAAALAREHKQMLSGALESMNEWTIEEYGGQLFYEEGDCLLVELELLG